ncbi:MAG: DNA polymerase III subunit delta' [Desulfobacteraceae bacterium]|jgi:DNA polymerase-3 subunit delta'
MFDSIIDQNKPISRLMTMLRNRSVPHALLFAGIDGIGKSSTAKAFTMMLNCHEKQGISIQDAGTEPCTCRSCRKILADTHPDILTIKPSGSLIKIAQIRELSQKLLVKPYEAAMRVVIIHDAHTMNPESGNALLKVLEEPPEKTMFILVTDQASDVLPTILSRCQIVAFNPVSRESIRSYLVRNKGIDSNRAVVAASMAGGSMAKALLLCEKNNNKPDPLVFRHFIFDELSNLIKGSTFDALSFAEKLSRKKESAISALELLLSFVRDMIVCPFDREKVINRDISDKIDGLSGTLSTSSLLKIADHITAAHQGIKANASVRLCLETMAIQMKRI